jgi:NAD(P)-dependent dehydrogenase (short-subunit alcohol dehydrogenase family)
MTNGLAGRVALVTGGSRGIGKATALALAEQGCPVVLAARKQDALDEAATEIRERVPGAEVLAMAAHAGDPEQARACVDAAVAAFGRVDILVNNAATNPHYGQLLEIDLGMAEKIVQVNQISVLLWTQLAYKASMGQHGGVVINIASSGGMITEPGIGFYNATKAAVIHLTRQFAAELGPLVRVNAIAPGLVRTRMARAVWEDYEDVVRNRLPLQRIGEPEDIAKVVVFLAGDDSAWMTGQTLAVDGGSLVALKALNAS